jgi:hypothetical protein
MLNLRSGSAPRPKLVSGAGRHTTFCFPWSHYQDFTYHVKALLVQASWKLLLACKATNTTTTPGVTVYRPWLDALSPVSKTLITNTHCRESRHRKFLGATQPSSSSIGLFEAGNKIAVRRSFSSLESEGVARRLHDATPLLLRMTEQAIVDLPEVRRTMTATLFLRPDRVLPFQQRLEFVAHCLWGSQCLFCIVLLHARKERKTSRFSHHGSVQIG